MQINSKFSKSILVYFLFIIDIEQHMMLIITEKYLQHEKLCFLYSSHLYTFIFQTDRERQLKRFVNLFKYS